MTQTTQTQNYKILSHDEKKYCQIFLCFFKSAFLWGEIDKISYWFFNISFFGGENFAKMVGEKNKTVQCSKTLHPIRQDHQTVVFKSNRPNLPWSTEAFLIAFQMRPKPRTAAMMKNVIHFSLVFSLNKCGALFHLFWGEGNVHIKKQTKVKHLQSQTLGILLDVRWYKIM